MAQRQLLASSLIITWDYRGLNHRDQDSQVCYVAHKYQQIKTEQNLSDFSLKLPPIYISSMMHHKSQNPVLKPSVPRT